MPFLIFRSLIVGAAKANEVLIWGKKKDAQELLDCGFIKYVVTLCLSADAPS